MAEMMTLVVTVPAAHKEALRRLAEDEGEPMAAIVRRLIRGEARRRGVWPQKHQAGEPERREAVCG